MFDDAIDFLVGGDTDGTWEGGEEGRRGGGERGRGLE